MTVTIADQIIKNIDKVCKGKDKIGKILKGGSWVGDDALKGCKSTINKLRVLDICTFPISKGRKCRIDDIDLCFIQRWKKCTEKDYREYRFRTFFNFFSVRQIDPYFCRQVCLDTVIRCKDNLGKQKNIEVFRLICNEENKLPKFEKVAKTNADKIKNLWCNILHSPLTK